MADTCRKSGAEAVEVHTADLSDSAAVAALTRQLLSAHATIDVLVNNAGRLPRTVDTPIDGELYRRRPHLNVLQKHDSSGQVALMRSIWYESFFAFTV